MNNTVYITMDQDWACDGVLEDTVSFVEQLNIPVCFFVTNDTPMLKKMRKHPLFTLGIHPNFLPQLNGQTAKSYLETLKEMHELVPEAKVIRCHALVDATPILIAAREMGFFADMNLFIPLSSGIALHPFNHFSGLKRLPFFFEDDAWMQEADRISPERHVLSRTPGLKIFNFHPIHLYLNSETMERYQQAKPFYHNFEQLSAFINHGSEYGARDFLYDVKRLADENNITVGKVSDIWN